MLQNSNTDPINLRILFIEDNEDDVLLIAETLRDAGYELTYRIIEHEPGLKDALHDDWDLILSDHNLPGFSPTRELELVKNSGKVIPFVIVSGEIEELTAIQAMQNGCSNYIYKDNLARLVPVVKREHEKNRIYKLDETTGLKNRNIFREELEHLILTESNFNHQHALILIDIDRFFKFIVVICLLAILKVYWGFHPA